MSDLDVVRRIADRGMKLAHERGPEFIDVFQHLLDEIHRAVKYAPEAVKQRDDLLAALKRIANGPWPDDVEGPEGQCEFDAVIAKAAIARCTPQPADPQPDQPRT